MTKFPSFSQWKQIFKVLKKSEAITLSVFLALAIATLAFLIINFYWSNTKLVSTLGGTYIEGVVGQPRFINPIYGETNDIDRTLINLVFSGLQTHDSKGGITNDLAENYTISPDGKIYDFQLKNNLFWHDGKPLTTDDIVFTIQTIQNSDYKSPLRANWIGVDVQKVSEKSVRFILKGSYNSFLENATVKILPKHIWQSVLPENFATLAYNLQPVGSGPFQFSKLSQNSAGFIKSFDLVSNRKYYAKPSFIANLSFQFFEKKEDLIKAASNREIDGFTLSSLENSKVIIQKEVHKAWLKNNFSAYHFSLPRYFAVFFNNQKNSIFSDTAIRQAMSYAVNKNELLQKINTETKSTVFSVNSPILPDFFNYQQPTTNYNFDINQAKTLLDKSGFKENTTGGREKPITKKIAFQFKSYLKLGSSGSEVTQLQACLARLPNSNFSSTILNKITSGTYDKTMEKAVTEFQEKYLPDVTPTGETGISTRTKLNTLCLTPLPNTQPLKFTITTIDQPQLIEVANALKSYWQAVGVQVEVSTLSTSDIKQVIKKRSYEALLYGEALGALPDLYPFWHSSQKIDPGLNLSEYDNKKADQLLKDARETTDPAVKQQKYEQLQNIIIADAPALFLYSPDYIYWILNSVQGIDTTKIIDPAKRFSNITNWFIKTKRVWK